MSSEQITTCDICGETYSDLKPRHWTDQICKVKLSLKDHTSVQSVAFDGDCCASCGHGLVKAIRDFAASKKPEAHP